MNRTSGKALGKLVVFVVLAGVAVLIGYGPAMRHVLALGFPRSSLQEYEALFSYGDRQARYDGDSLYRTGKVVLVVPSRWSVYRVGTLFSTCIDPTQAAKKEAMQSPPKLDDSFYRVESSVRAGTPAEVDTVILCEYAKSRDFDLVYSYGSEDGGPPTGQAVFRRCVRLFVYDRTTRRHLGNHIIWGEKPEVGDTKRIPPIPPGAVPDWVNRLPVRR